ncbi:hypothetical protein BJY52DRAFT_1190246 [Lactarius psammicola]|nr:hypothetical protein BJY52DRAFT_1190246 [Lactarius psammicola]
MVGDYCNTEDEEEVIPSALDKTCEPGIMFDRNTPTQLSWTSSLQLYIFLFSYRHHHLFSPLGPSLSLFLQQETHPDENTALLCPQVVLEKKSSLSSASIHNEIRNPPHVDAEALVVNSTHDDGESSRRHSPIRVLTLVGPALLILD